MKRFLSLPLLCAAATASTALCLYAASDQSAGREWWSYVQYLASDQLEGRNTGSSGYRQAADYVAHQFADDGLRPAGQDGYMQPVQFDVIRVNQERSKSALIPQQAGQASVSLASGEDVIFSTRADWQGHVQAPLVFVGYGLSAPDAGYNDLAGVDLNGKIAVYLSGAGPSSVPGNLRAHFGSARERWKAFKAAGAIGTVTIQNPAAMDIPWSRIRNNASQPGMILADPALQATAGERAGLSINPAKAEILFRGSGHTFAEILALGQAGKPLPHFPLTASLRIDPVFQRSKVVSPNIVAALPGSDPQLRSQFVVLSAHLDHLGIGHPINGDAIFNGAMDNASGVASLLEMAHELKTSGTHPRRSLLFVVVTGEEKGLLGSEYFTAHPTVPAKSMIADLNIDMFLPIHPLDLLIVYGMNESSLGGVVRRIAAEHHIETRDDPMPERNVFIRSDQYNFILHGVPAVMCAIGAKPGTNDWNLDAQWLKSRYHAPSDDVNQPVDKDAAALYNQIVLQSALAVADNPQEPTWNQSSFFRRFAD